MATISRYDVLIDVSIAFSGYRNRAAFELSYFKPHGYFLCLLCKKVFEATTICCPRDENHKPENVIYVMGPNEKGSGSPFGNDIKKVKKLAYEKLSEKLAPPKMIEPALKTAFNSGIAKSE